MAATTLTSKQCSFVNNFVAGNNATEAARLAGYSQRSAKQLGSRLTKVDQIQRMVTERRQQDAIRLELKKEHVIAGLLMSVQLARENGTPMPMIRGLVELATLCGFYKATAQQQSDDKKDLRCTPTADLLRKISENGQYRNADGSMMCPAQIDDFYSGLTDAELTALAEGRAVVETRVVMRA